MSNIISEGVLDGYINEGDGLFGSITNVDVLTGNIMATVLKGLSAYEVAVKDGYVGTEEEWLQSLVGESVVVNVVSDTETEYILSFTVGDNVVITPNLKCVLERGVDYLTPEDIEQLISEAQTVTLEEVDEFYLLQSAFLTNSEIEELLNL